MTRILATDVYYDEPNRALAAGVAFSAWTDERPSSEHTMPFDGIAPYEPGSFYKRELPCLIGLIGSAPWANIILIDGYVDVTPDHDGLGRHLYNVLGDSTRTIIGVAKSHFAGTHAVPVLRGESKSPLYVTAVGGDLDMHAAADLVRSMHGPYRIPTLLQRVDALSRGNT